MSTQLSSAGRPPRGLPALTGLVGGWLLAAAAAGALGWVTGSTAALPYQLSEALYWLSGGAPDLSFSEVADLGGLSQWLAARTLVRFLLLVAVGVSMVLLTVALRRRGRPVTGWAVAAVVTSASWIAITLATILQDWTFSFGFRLYFVPVTTASDIGDWVPAILGQITVLAIVAALPLGIIAMVSRRSVDALQPNPDDSSLGPAVSPQRTEASSAEGISHGQPAVWSESAPPGWYPYEAYANTQRFWDGSAWTERIAPLNASVANVRSSLGGMADQALPNSVVSGGGESNPAPAGVLVGGGPAVGFVEAVRRAFASYAVLRGRATRAEYWWWVLFFLVAWFAGIFMDALLGTSIGGVGSGLGLFTLAVVLVLFLPGLGVSVRRLHDSGRSGWWYLIAWLPFGGLVLLVFQLMPSDAGPNRYGPPSR